MKIQDLTTPSFLVDLDVLEQNIQEMADLCKENNKELWPMVKTHKSSQVAQRQMDVGIGGFLAGTIDEAEKLINEGFKDIILAYPVAANANIARIVELLKNAHLILAFDGETAAKEANQALSKEGLIADYVIIIDSGLHRFGVSPDKTGDLAEVLSKYQNLKLKGISTHPGQVYAATNTKEVEKVAQDEIEALEEAIDSLKDKGFSAEMVATGSTPTAKFAVKCDMITAIRPGNYVFYDNIQIAMGVVAEERCSLAVLATIIAQPTEDRFLLDAGSKCFGLDTGAHGLSNVRGFGLVKGHPELVVAGLSEEVAKVTIEGDTDLKVGDKVLVIPNHSCSSANMTNYLIGHRKGEVEEIIYIDARGGTVRKPPIK